MLRQTTNQDETGTPRTTPASTGGVDACAGANGPLLPAPIAPRLPSHEYQFTLLEFCRATLPTILVLFVLAALLMVGRRFSWLPAPAQGTDPDRMVLAHQVRASRGESSARLVVVGDSTCLQGVDAPELARQVGGDSPVLSLALFIWIDLDVYGRLVSDFAHTHPAQLQTVVLLVSPSKLTGLGQIEGAREYWRQVQLLEGRREKQETWFEPKDLFGSRQFRQCFISHLVATPLRGSGAAAFGFTTGIDDYMAAHNGSLVSFETVTPRKSARRVGAAQAAESGGDWTLAPDAEADSLAFRSRIPPGIRLCAGFTPSMAGIVSPEESRLRQALLHRWNQSIKADVLLTNLPASLPDVFFASGNHLNATGQRIFTRLLACQLQPFLGQQPERPTHAMERAVH